MSIPSIVVRSFLENKANIHAVSEVIAVIIRNPGNKHGAFLGPQLFAGFSYIVATFIMLELWRVHRKSKIQEKQEARGQDVEMASISRTAAVIPQR